MPKLRDKNFIIRPNERLSFTIEDLSSSEYQTAGDTHGKLDMNVQTKEFVYVPNKDFTGEVHLVLSYNKNFNNAYTKVIAIKIQIANTLIPAQ